MLCDAVITFWSTAQGGPATQGVAVVRDVQVLTTEHGLQPLQRMWRQIRGILR